MKSTYVGEIWIVVYGQLLCQNPDYCAMYLLKGGLYANTIWVHHETIF